MVGTAFEKLATNTTLLTNVPEKKSYLFGYYFTILRSRAINSHTAQQIKDKHVEGITQKFYPTGNQDPVFDKAYRQEILQSPELLKERADAFLSGFNDRESLQYFHGRHILKQELKQMKERFGVNVAKISRSIKKVYTALREFMQMERFDDHFSSRLFIRAFLEVIGNKGEFNGSSIGGMATA